MEPFSCHGFCFEVIRASTLFLKNRRFDLIYKIKWAEAMKNCGLVGSFYRDMYLTSIKHFNHFYERNPKKESAQDFLREFEFTLENIRKNGFNFDCAIPVSFDGQLINGAHRLAACVALKRKIAVRIGGRPRNNYDYKLFIRNRLPEGVADWGVLEYIKLNPKAFIVSLFPLLPIHFDLEVEVILKKYGFIYYKKSLLLTEKGCLNLMRFNYHGKPWIGNPRNDFCGLRESSRMSMGGAENGSLRAFVFVCEDTNFVKLVEKEICALLNVGSFVMHVTHTKEKITELAQTFFNKNSWFVLNHRPFNMSFFKLDKFVDTFKEYLLNNNYNPNDFCVCGSTSMALFGFQKVVDFSFMHLSPSVRKSKNRKMSAVSQEQFLNYYSQTKEVIIVNPEHHFYYRGVKFITLKLLQEMKSVRRKGLKDVKDIEIISNFLKKKW